MFDVATAIALIVFLVLLLRAAHVLGSDPDERTRERGKLAGSLLPETTRDAKLRT